MQTIDDLPFGDPDFRLRAAARAWGILNVVRTLKPHGNLDNGMVFNTNNIFVDNKKRVPGASRQSDLKFVVKFLDNVAGVEGVDEIVNALGPDADEDTHAVLVQYFEDLKSISQALEDNSYPDLWVALTELIESQNTLDAALGLIPF